MFTYADSTTEVVKATGAPVSSQQIFHAAQDQADKEFGAVRGQKNIQLTPQLAKMLDEEILPSVRLGTAATDIRDQLETDGTITGTNLEAVRKRLGDVAFKAKDPNLYLLNKDFMATLGQEVPSLSEATQHYREGMDLVRGAQHGEDILAGPNGHTNYMSDYAALNDLEKSGAQLGARSAIIDAAGTPQGAQRVAGQLGSDPTLQARLAAVLSPKDAASLARYGKSESGAAARSQFAAPTFAGQEKPSVTGTEVAHGVMGLALAPKHMILSAYHLSRLGQEAVSGAKLPPEARKVVAGWLTDPAQRSKALAVLAKAGVAEAKLSRLAASYANVGGYTAGTASGIATNRIAPGIQ